MPGDRVFRGGHDFVPVFTRKGVVLPAAFATRATPDMAFLVASADLIAGGKLDSTPDMVFAIPSADLTSQVSNILATPDMVFAMAIADLMAEGKLDGTPDLVFAVPAAALSSINEIDASPDLTFGIPLANLVNSTAEPAPRVLYVNRLVGVSY